MSTIDAKRELRSSSHLDIYLIGSVDHRISGAKLPSTRQTLEVFFYNTRVVKLNTRESARLAVREVQIFWDKARIPTRREDKIIEKLLAVYENWESLRKSRNRRNEKQIDAEKNFVNNVDDLFDIARNDAMEIMKNQEDKDFLENQLKKGRPGCMLGVDGLLAAKEERKMARIEQQEKRRLQIEAAEHEYNSKYNYSGSGLWKRVTKPLLLLQLILMNFLMNMMLKVIMRPNMIFPAI